MSKQASNLKGYNSAFAQRLRDLMGNKSQKITQKELAKEIGCTRQAISQYMDGTSIPNADKLLELSNALDVSVDYLLGRTDFSTRNPEIKEICEYIGLDSNVIQILHNIFKSEGKNNSVIKLLNFLFKSNVTISFYSLADMVALHKYYLNNKNHSVEKATEPISLALGEASIRYLNIENYKDKIDLNEYNIQKEIINLLKLYCD